MLDRSRAVALRFLHVVPAADLPGLAAELAYRFLFAIFPFVLFVASLSAFVAGWLGLGDPTGQIVSSLGDNLPPALVGTIRPELEQVVGTARPELLSVAAILALWAATGGTNALIKGMNRAYEVEETRPFVRRLLLALGLTLLASVGILVAFVTIVGGALITEQLAARLGISGQAWALITFARWPIAFALLVVAVAVLYRLAPNIRLPWRWTIAGAAVFAVGWLVATWGFAWYVSNISRFGVMYGTLAGVIVLMLWFYLTALILVGAAALLAATASVVVPERLQARRDEIEAAKPRPMVVPPAAAADTAERATSACAPGRGTGARRPPP